MHPPRLVLLVCTGNTCRSPIAEGLLKQFWSARQDVVVRSTGISALPGTPAAGEAVLAARELGADISRHAASSLDEAMLKQAVLVITMTPAQAGWLRREYPGLQGRIKSLGELACGDGGLTVEDPFGGSPDTYRRTAQQIEQLLQAALPAMSAWLVNIDTKTEGCK